MEKHKVSHLLVKHRLMFQWRQVTLLSLPLMRTASCLHNVLHEGFIDKRSVIIEVNLIVFQELFEVPMILGVICMDVALAVLHCADQ